MTTGRINQINNYVNDKKTGNYSSLKSLVTFEYLVSLIIKNNVDAYPNKVILCKFSPIIMKTIKIQIFFRYRRKIRKYWNP